MGGKGVWRGVKFWWRKKMAEKNYNQIKFFSFFKSEGKKIRPKLNGVGLKRTPFYLKSRHFISPSISLPFDLLPSYAIVPLPLISLRWLHFIEVLKRRRTIEARGKIFNLAASLSHKSALIFPSQKGAFPWVLSKWAFLFRALA